MEKGQHVTFWGFNQVILKRDQTFTQYKYDFV